MITNVRCPTLCGEYLTALHTSTGRYEVVCPRCGDLHNEIDRVAVTVAHTRAEVLWDASDIGSDWEEYKLPKGFPRPTGRASLKSWEAARRFFEALLAMGISFHPDDPLSEIVERETGRRVFLPHEAERVEGMMSILWTHLGVHIYEVGLACMRRHLKADFGPEGER